MRDVFLNLGVAFVPVSIVLASLWLSARARAHKAEETIRLIALNAAAQGGVHPSRNSAVTAALDAMAVEVERIAEGQRFTTKLLSEQRDAGPSQHAWDTRELRIPPHG